MPLAGAYTAQKWREKAKFGRIDSPEQLALSRTCRKLREGDVLKFVKEIRMEDEE